MTAQLLLEEMGREWARIDVVRDCARRDVVAFSNYWIVADEVHLLNLATHPEARRAGHASRLLAHIIEVGRRARCRFVTLEVRRSNAAAAAALPAVRLQGGRRSPELLRRRPGRRDRDAAGSDLNAGNRGADAGRPSRDGRGRGSRSGGTVRPSRRPGHRAAPGVDAREPAPAPPGPPSAASCRSATSRRASRRSRSPSTPARREPTSPASTATCSTSSSARRVPMTIFVSGRWVEAHAGRHDRAGRAIRWSSSAITPTTTRTCRVFRSRASSRRLTRPRRRWPATASAAWRFGRPFGEWSHRTGLRRSGSAAADGDVGRRLRRSERAHDRRRDDPERPRQGAPGFDHHLSHQRARRKTAEALPDILRGLRERGLRFVPAVPELLADGAGRRRRRRVPIPTRRLGHPAAVGRGADLAAPPPPRARRPVTRAQPPTPRIVLRDPAARQADWIVGIEPWRPRVPAGRARPFTSRHGPRRRGLDRAVRGAGAGGHHRRRWTASSWAASSRCWRSGRRRAGRGWAAR